MDQRPVKIDAQRQSYPLAMISINAERTIIL